MNSRTAIAIACLALPFTVCAQEQGKPIITVDYEQQRHDRMLELQRQELGATSNQWPRFRELMDEIKPFLDAARKEDAALWDDDNDWAGCGFSIYSYVPDGGTHAQYQGELARVLDRLDAWRHRHFFELTAALAQLEGVMPPPRHTRPAISCKALGLA